MFSSLTCILHVILIPLHGWIASLQPKGLMRFLVIVLNVILWDFRENVSIKGGGKGFIIMVT